MSDGLGVTVERLVPAILPLVRQLIQRGFLLPPTMMANSQNHQKLNS